MVVLRSRVDGYFSRIDGALVFEKRSDEIATFTVDLTDWLPSGDTWSTVTEKDSGGLTLGTATISGNTLSVPVTDGTGFVTYTITTTGGFEFELPIRIQGTDTEVQDVYA